jgi:hypothetical protein
MQSMMDHWEGGIRASGGALIREESSWYLMMWEWRNDQWHYRLILDTPGNLSITLDGGAQVNIDRLDVSEAKETGMQDDGQ